LASIPGPEDTPAVSLASVRARRRGFERAERCELDTFQESMSRPVSGVAGVTVRGDDGAPKGMLATSHTSYSSEPPSALVWVSRSARTHDPLVGAAGFGVELLADAQDEVARRLAEKHDDKFGLIDWDWDGDMPRLGGSCVYLGCTRAASFVHGNHTILLGDIEVAEVSDIGPLVYFRRSFDWRLGTAPAAPERN
jgi:flavin reductase ActVB